MTMTMYNHKMHEVIDIPFCANTELNPFKDLTFYAEVTGDCETKKVYGFFNGNNEYILRLSFNKAGTYSYKTYSNLAELNGKQGDINVCENSEKNGAIVLDENNKQRLFYENGEPYHLCAFECDWLFSVGYGEGPKKAEKLVKYIADNKFNQVVMNVYANDLRWNTPEWMRDERIKPEHDQSGREDIFPFLGSNSKPDFSMLNTDFFKHLDSVISLLDKHNIVAHLMIYVWNKNVNWPRAYSDEDNMYFDYVVNRYGAYSNILWDISKEALAYGRCDNFYIIDRILRLKSIDTYKRLLTVHEFRFCDKYPELVDIIAMQDWACDIYNLTVDIAQKHSDKVIFNVEHGGYEEGMYHIFTGNYTNAETCLRRNYEIMFAGAYSAYYWQPLAWSITVMPWEQETPPHFEYYKHMVEFFTKFDYTKFTPQYKFGNMQNGGRVLANGDESLVLIYVPKDNYGICINYKQIHPTNVTYYFFNTLTGEYSQKQKLCIDAHVTIPKVFGCDSVLVLELEKSN